MKNPFNRWSFNNSEYNRYLKQRKITQKKLAELKEALRQLSERDIESDIELMESEEDKETAKKLFDDLQAVRDMHILYKEFQNNEETGNKFLEWIEEE